MGTPYDNYLDRDHDRECALFENAKDECRRHCPQELCHVCGDSMVIHICEDDIGDAVDSEVHQKSGCIDDGSVEPICWACYWRRS